MTPHMATSWLTTDIDVSTSTHTSHPAEQSTASSLQVEPHFMVRAELSGLQWLWCGELLQIGEQMGKEEAVLLLL